MHLPKEAAHIPTTAARRRVQISLYIEVTGTPSLLAWALATIWTKRLALGPQPLVDSTANGMKSQPAREQASWYLATLAVSALDASTEGATPGAEAEQELRNGWDTVTSMAKGLPALNDCTAGRRMQEAGSCPGGLSGGSRSGTCCSMVTTKPALEVLPPVFHEGHCALHIAAAGTT